MIEFIAGCFVGVAIAKKVRVISEWSLPPYIRIVKMTNEKYAIRRGYLFGYEWFDLDDDLWWPKRHAYRFCYGSLELCQERMKHAGIGNGTPI